MKMIKFGAGIAGLLMSAMAFAGTYDDATVALTSDIDNEDCAALAGVAKVNLSTNVIAAAHCRTVHGDVYVATCHAKGNVAPTTENCGCVDNSATATPDWQPNISLCGGSCDSTGNYSPVGETVLLAGRKAFGATTSGGSLQSYTLGDTGQCVSGNLTAVSSFFPG